MRKRKKFLLTAICLCIIGGSLYKTIYEVKKHEKSVQAIKINEENIDKEKARLKAAAEKIVKVEETIASKPKTENKAEIKEKSPAKAQENKSATKERSKMVIVIDPGHSSRTSLEKEQRAPGSSIMKIKEPGGAEGISTNTPEYVVNMEVAVRLKGLLEEKGYTVIMTKTEHKQMLGNIARAEVGNKAKADLVIRIHADSSDNSSIKGASMLVPANTETTGAIYKTSKKYGTIVLNNLINNVGMENRGVVERNDMTGFNWSKVPVILVEMGFQSNVYEDKLLATGTYQDKLAKALSEGIDKALIE
jgi:N-acetylmuramoyl-L-alanine amidase